MNHVLYATINTFNQKFYIGVHSTDDLNDGYMGSGIGINRAIKKHGRDKFDWLILKEFETAEEAFAEEARVVDQAFIDREDTYNMALGGQGGSLGEDVRKRRAESTKAAWANTQLRELTSKRIKGSNHPQFGTIHSLTWNQRIGNSLRASGKSAGANNSAHGTFWITNGCQSKQIRFTELIPEGWANGRHTTQETRQKQSAAHKGKPWSDARRAASIGNGPELDD